MKKSRIILLFKIILIISFFTYIIWFYFNNSSKYNENDSEFIGTIIKLNYKNNKTSIILDTKEKLLINIYSKTDLKIGDKLRVKGTLKIPSINSNFYAFNYKKYLLSQKIYYMIDTNNYEKIDENISWYYKLKNKIIDRIKNFEYLNAFLIGDTSYIDMDSYRVNGISHLFAISGLHITFFTIILDKILKKIFKKNFINILFISIFLLFYIFLTTFSVSVIRASLMFILLKLNKILKLRLKTIEILGLIFMLLMVINPYYIYNVSFKFSFIVSFYLISFNKLINQSNNYFRKLFIISLISFLVSFPITINNFNDVNILSILLNMIFVPFFTFIIFPFAIICFLLPFLNPIFNFFIGLFNYLSKLFSSIKFFYLSFPHLNIYLCIVYYLLVTIVLYKIYKKKYYYFSVLILFFFFLYNIIYFKPNSIITFFDVGQGDASLIQFKNNRGNILIDTGGNINSNYSLSKNIIIPYLKSVGIHKLNYLILTHGDYDHMGEAINLVNNFKVEKVIFNCGEYNNLEKDLIKVLDKKKIPYYSCIKELNIDDNKLNFLQTKEYDNENDNSNVIYTEINGYKFMLMGDASITTEKEILKKYNLPDIDVLKIGHHGSKTSSSESFINEMNPKYSIISVGKNNRYGHPNKEVLEVLKNRKIYRTDLNSSIMIKIKNNRLKIETCTQ